MVFNFFLKLCEFMALLFVKDLEAPKLSYVQIHLRVFLTHHR